MLEETLLWWLLRRWRRRTTEAVQWEAATQFAIRTEQEAVTDATKALLRRAEHLRQAQMHNGRERADLIDTHQMPPKEA